MISQVIQSRGSCYGIEAGRRAARSARRQKRYGDEGNVVHYVKYCDARDSLLRDNIALLPPLSVLPMRAEGGRGSNAIDTVDEARRRGDVTMPYASVNYGYACHYDT